MDAGVRRIHQLLSELYGLVRRERRVKPALRVDASAHACSGQQACHRGALTGGCEKGFSHQRRIILSFQDEHGYDRRNNPALKRRAILVAYLRHEDRDAARTAIQRQIDATDRQIDLLVYELYELSDGEIGIVEEATG